MKVVHLGFLILSFFASCAQVSDQKLQSIEIYNRDSYSPSKIPNKVLTATAKITLEDKLGSIVTGSTFPIYSKEVDTGHHEVYFITAAHVVRGVTPIKIEFYSMPNKNWEISNLVTLVLRDVETVYTHDAIDVALVKAKSKVIIPLIDLAVENPKFLEEVAAVGCPFGEPLHISHGRLVRPSLGNQMWLLTAPVAPGNSGGPIISLRTGKVVGITSRVYTVNFGFSAAYISHMHEMTPSYLFYNIMVRELKKDLLK